MNGKDKVQGDQSLKNDCLEMASEKTDPERLTCPLDTNKFITVNYSTNTLKYIPHAQQTSVQKSQRAKTDPERLTCPLDTNKFITVNYSTNTLKYIPHAQQTSVQKSQRAKTKGSLINGCLVLYILFVMF